MARVRRVFAAPFVVTAALGGCKNDEPPRVESRAAAIDARVVVDPPPDATKVVKVPPEAPADVVTIRDGAVCKQYVGKHARAQPVRCPIGGATLTAPPPRADPSFRYQSDYFQCSDFSKRSGPNPPASVVVPCPPDLLPTLNASLEPTRNGDACSFQDIPVHCPPELPAPRDDAVVYLRDGACFVKGGGLEPVRCPDGGPSLALPEEDAVTQPNGDDIRLSVNTLSCENHRHFDCGQGIEHTCNPPPPHPVECPEEILPALIHGEPSRTEAGKCWWHDIQVRCPR